MISLLNDFNELSILKGTLLHLANLPIPPCSKTVSIGLLNKAKELNEHESSYSKEVNAMKKYGSKFAPQTTTPLCVPV